MAGTLIAAQLKPHPLGNIQQGRTDLSEPSRVGINKPNDPDAEATPTQERLSWVTNGPVRTGLYLEHSPTTTYGTKDPLRRIFRHGSFVPFTTGHGCFIDPVF